MRSSVFQGPGWQPMEISDLRRNPERGRDEVRTLTLFKLSAVNTDADSVFSSCMLEKTHSGVIDNTV